jgi:hypothetical protein
MNDTIMTLAAKASPPITVTMLSIAGIPLQEWVYLVTIGYVILQSFVLMVKFIFWAKGKKDSD